MTWSARSRRPRRPDARASSARQVPAAPRRALSRPRRRVDGAQWRGCAAEPRGHRVRGRRSSTTWPRSSCCSAPQRVAHRARAGDPRQQPRAGDRQVALLLGRGHVSAAGLCADVGRFERFPRPTLLSGFLGIVPSERTSDTKRRQGQITKAGPTHARRLLIEAAHHYRHPPRIGDVLARRQAGQDPRVIAIAWRAQRRLHQRRPPARPAAQARRRRRGRLRARAGRVLLGGRHA